MVPQFTVIVRPIADKPELVLRKHFKNGVFTIAGLRKDKYQVQVISPRFIGMKMDVHFPKNKTASHYRLIVLHKLRNELRTPTGNAIHTVSARALQQQIPDRAKEAYARGIELHNEGKLEEALSAYGEAIRTCPDYLPALTDTGTVYIILNRPDSALTFLRRAHRVDESNVVVRLNMAIALMNKREYVEAMDLLDAVYRDEPRKSIPMFFMARVKFYQKDYPEAERLLRLALEEDSTMLDGWVMLFNLALEQEEYQTAREALGSLREAMNNRLFSEFVQGQLDELSN